MVRSMCGASLNVRPGGVRVANKEQRDRLCLGYISVVMWKGRLRWFGHVERIRDDNVVERGRVRSVNIEGLSARGRPKKTWNEVMQKDFWDMGSSSSSSSFNVHLLPIMGLDGIRASSTVVCSSPFLP